MILSWSLSRLYDHCVPSLEILQLFRTAQVGELVVKETGLRIASYSSKAIIVHIIFVNIIFGFRIILQTLKVDNLTPRRRSQLTKVSDQQPPEDIRL